MTKLSLFLCTLLVLSACSGKWLPLAEKDILRIPQEYATGQKIAVSPCSSPLSYIPDSNHLDHTPMKYIRINFHFVNTTDSTCNYYGQKAVDFTKELLWHMNSAIEKNRKLRIPPNNTIPALPPRYQYVLTPDPAVPGDSGIYYHFDDTLYSFVNRGKNKNISDRRVIEKYAVRKNEVLNVFVLSHHRDSLKSPTYFVAGAGIAMGTALKLAGVHESGQPGVNFRGIANHEIGHILGLSHTWNSNDGCDDTVLNPNCEGVTSTPPCDTMASNNMMDYNQCECAISPCQIGTIHRNLANLNYQARKLLQPNWCEIHPDRHIYIRDTVHWQSAKDLEGELTIEPGGSLQISCRLSLPENAAIYVKAGGELILDNCQLHNACGKQWKGIRIEERNKVKGKVVYLGEPKVENIY
jgi:hypothetical protein